MNEFFAYLMESTVCMLIFWAVYLILLRRTTFFSLNRLYLIMSLIISMIIPLISIPTEQSNSLQLRPQMQSLAKEIVVSQIEPINNISVQNIQVDNPQIEVSDSVNYGVIAYSFVSVLLFLFYSYSIFRIFRLRRNSQIMEIKGLQVAVSNQDNITPFSFLKTFYFSKKLLLNSDFDHIIEHEAGHIKHLHSLDLIGICILKSIFWCNPMIYIIEKSLKENHEFTADKIVIKKGVQPRYYKELLLRSTYADLFSAPVNSFSMSIIKKRFNMLDKNNSSRKSLIKYAAFLPILALLIAMFACGGNPPKQDTIMKQYILTKDMSNFSDGTCFDTNGIKIPIENARRFDDIELKQSLVNRTDLPEEAVKAGITNVSVRVKCVIAPDGSCISTDTKDYKIVGKEWRQDDRFGLFNKASDAVLKSIHLTKHIQIDSNISNNLIPCFQVQTYIVNFGDYEVWKALDDVQLTVSIETTEDNERKKKDGHYVDWPKVQAYFYENVKYPKSQIQNNISGKVLVSFVVNKEGKVINPKIESGINEAFDAEVMRVINSFANSNIYIGTANNAKVTLPVKFELK